MSITHQSASRLVQSSPNIIRWKGVFAHRHESNHSQEQTRIFCTCVPILQKGIRGVVLGDGLQAHLGAHDFVVLHTPHVFIPEVPACVFFFAQIHLLLSTMGWPEGDCTLGGLLRGHCKERNTPSVEARAIHPWQRAGSQAVRGQCSRTDKKAILALEPNLSRNSGTIISTFPRKRWNSVKRCGIAFLFAHSTLESGGLAPRASHVVHFRMLGDR